ncbi:MAG: glutamate racemase [Candidatus Omnitrophica bacterium]|nr:glutamate racemase [Candidatus Omnitrophota bacterium]
MDNRPIGVFDSGVGGLTVVKQLMRQLPREDIVYFGDTARVPYGTKSKQTIIRFSLENVLFLLKHNVKSIVVACNTSSSVALVSLKKHFKIPVIGVINPGVTDALSSTRSMRIGVIGTSTTIRSMAYKRQILRNSPSAKVFSQSCPLFVPLAEEGWLRERITLQVIEKYLAPLKRKRIDTLILGCTHYPLLKENIKRVVGKRVKLIDSAASTAKAVKVLMEDKDIASSSMAKGRVQFFVSDEPSQFKKVGEKFLGKSLVSARKVNYGL